MRQLAAGPQLLSLRAGPREWLRVSKRDLDWTLMKRQILRGLTEGAAPDLGIRFADGTPPFHSGQTVDVGWQGPAGGC